VAKDLSSTISLETISRELERARRQDGFDTLWFDELVAALATQATFDERTAERDKLDICTQAIFTAAKAGSITGSSLKAELDQRCRTFISRPSEQFVLVASLSVEYFKGLSRRTVDGWTLTFSDGPPSGFDRSFVPQHVWTEYDKSHLQMAHVRVAGRARTIYEALDQALERLDLTRGIWNYILNRGVWSQSGPRENQPINELRIGPIHTMHRPDGTPVSTDMWWYELFQFRDPFSFDATRKWRNMAERENAIRAVLRETDLGPELRKVIVRYCRALDGGDHDLVLLQLWSLLETLTGTTQGRGYDETIRRTEFLYGDEPLVHHVLESLRVRRNRLAHAGAGGSEARKTALVLHRFVGELLECALQLSGRFSNLDEMGRFLAMSRDDVSLKKEIDVRRMALKFRTSHIRGRKLARKKK